MSEIIIGIDLGTTNSEVAALIDGRIEIIEEDGNPILPSFVGLNDEARIITGVEARNQYALHPERTIRSIKREMGTDKKVKLGDKEYRPQEISAIILRKLKERAERRLGGPVQKAVITVPAQFSDAQRQATRDAGAIAGLEVVRIVNEPTAATLAYNIKSEDKAQKVLAFDLGGGTFDVSIVNIEKDVVEVISSHGDNHLGGDDIDALIAEWVIKKVYEKQQQPALITDISQLRLQRSAELAKMQLSDYPHAKIIEDNIFTKDNTREKVMEELGRAEFEEMIQPILNKTIFAVHQALADARLKPKDIDTIILVGGATRSPVIEAMLTKELGKQPRKDIHPELAVAYGAGVMAARLMGEEKQRILIDITPYTFGTSCLGVVDGEYCDYMYVPVLKAGTPLPASKAESFYTVQDEQEGVEVKIFQGENPDARKNILVGDFRITGLSKVPSGNEIILNMRLDLDGILRVTAIEHVTNLSKTINITNALGKLSDEQIEKSRREIETMFGTPSDEEEEEGEYEVLSTEEIKSGEVLQDKFRQMSEKVKQAQTKMDEIDKADASRLLKQLEAAYQARDNENFAKIYDELDDLLFYVKVE